MVHDQILSRVLCRGTASEDVSRPIRGLQTVLEQERILDYFIPNLEANQTLGTAIS